MKRKGRADGYESLTRDELMGLLRERDRTVAKQREKIRRLEEKLARAIAEGAAKQEQLMLRNYNDFVTKRDSVGAAKNASGAKLTFPSSMLPAVLKGLLSGAAS